MLRSTDMADQTSQPEPPQPLPPPPLPPQPGDGLAETIAGLRAQSLVAPCAPNWPPPTWTPPAFPAPARIPVHIKQNPLWLCFDVQGNGETQITQEKPVKADGIIAGDIAGSLCYEEIHSTRVIGGGSLVFYVGQFTVQTSDGLIYCWAGGLFDHSHSKGTGRLVQIMNFKGGTGIYVNCDGQINISGAQDPVDLKFRSTYQGELCLRLS